MLTLTCMLNSGDLSKCSGPCNLNQKGSSRPVHPVPIDEGLQSLRYHRGQNVSRLAKIDG